MMKMITVGILFTTQKVLCDTQGEVADVVAAYVAKGVPHNSIYIKYESASGFYSMIIWVEESHVYREYLKDLSWTGKSYTSLQQWYDSDRHIHPIRSKQYDVDEDAAPSMNGDMFGDDDF